MKRIFIVTESNMGHLCEQVKTAQIGDVIEIKPPTRNLEQNALLWALLQTISRQVDWYGQKLSDWDWKHIFSSSLNKTKVVPGLEAGSFVVCGLSTSKMGKKDFSEMIELIYAFGAEHGVQWPVSLGYEELNK